MSLALHVDTARWRDHLGRYVGSLPDAVDVVPVTKGNGYGFGNATLGAEAARLGCSTLAVGTYEEIDDVHDSFGGDVLVLTPWRPHDDRATATLGADDPRLIHTVSRRADLDAIATASRPASQPTRVVVEVLTSMHRHGVNPDRLTDALAFASTAGMAVEGVALHLPLAGDHTEEAIRLGRAAVEAAPAGAPLPALWVSHLTPGAAGVVAAAVGIPVRLRVATALWLGDRTALKARGRVLDVHRVRRGDRVGYRQRRVRRDGHLLVVGGGTAHGIALEAPTAASTLRQRGVSVAHGLLEAAGRALSPFTVAGRQRWFAEPPHMQCSLLLVPADVDPPNVGDDIDVDVRFTTTTFDDIIWS